MQKKQPPQQKKPKPTIPLMELLAFNSSIPARKLLRKYGKEDAIGYKDLQLKLEDLYSSLQDKLELEKELAEIHPHKDFILKYLTPEPAITKITVAEPQSACEGKPDCDCKKSSAEGIVAPEPLKPFNTDFLISSVAIVAIVGLVIYSTKK